MKLDRIIAVRTDKTVYRDGDNCIKVFNEGYSKSDVLNEALNQSRVEETGLNIPKIKEVTMIDGKWAIVSEYIEGKTLDRLIKEEPEKKEEYLQLFVDVQLEMHSKNCELLTRLKDKMSHKISLSELDATTRYDFHTRLEAMPKHKKLCHGDFNLSNVIITSEGKKYILDWSHATQGNASADVARTYLLFCLSGDTETANRYLELFCQKSDTEKSYVEKWLPIVATSQSVNGNLKERQFLLSWADVTNYE